MKTWKSGLFVALLVTGLLSTSCATARHRAVQSTEAFAAVVFAIDDAATAACQTKVLTQAQCDALNPYVVKALTDVKEAILVLQATPRTATVPKTLPDLIGDLATLQRMAAPLGQSALLEKINAAITQAASVLAAFGG